MKPTILGERGYDSFDFAIIVNRTWYRFDFKRPGDCLEWTQKGRIARRCGTGYSRIRDQRDSSDLWHSLFEQSKRVSPVLVQRL
jgi:hypothetical protein